MSIVASMTLIVGRCTQEKETMHFSGNIVPIITQCETNGKFNATSMFSISIGTENSVGVTKTND